MFYCQRKKIEKVTVFLLVIILALTFFQSRIFAETNIVNFEPRFIGSKKISSPDKIILVKIKPKISDQTKFLQSLDLLFIDNLNLNQNIFSYISVGATIYKLHDIDETYSKNQNDGNLVYIGYTDNPPAALISNLMYAYGIKKISNGNISFQKNTFNVSEVSSNTSFSPIPAPLSVANVSVSYEKNPDPASIINVDVKFNNSSNYPIFKSEPSPIIAVSIKDNKETNSPMFLNEIWNSKSRAGSISNVRIASKEDGTLSLPVLSGIIPGVQKETFTLAKPDGTFIPNSTFTVEFNIPNKGQKYAEAKDNGYGFINFRADKNPNGRVIGFVNKGTLLLILEESGAWTKVKYEGNKEAWVQSGYLKKLN